MNISLPLLHNYDVKLPNFTFYEGREHEKTSLIFYFSELRYSRLEFNTRTIRHYLSIERDGIRAKKFKAARIHVLCDVFAAIAGTAVMSTGNGKMKNGS